MTTITPTRLLVIDDNEKIHDDFRKIFCRRPDNSELDELAAELFGDPIEPDDSPAKPSTFDLRFASQGQEGFEILAESIAKGEMFDAAFVDMRMPPGWDGVETIEHLWAADPDIQIVICTAYSDHGWDCIVSRLGVTDNLIVLKKPFDKTEIIQIATSLTEKRRRLTESRNTID